MNVNDVQALCSGFPGSSAEAVGPPSNVLVYAIGVKQFAYFKNSDPEKWRFSIRVTPDRFVELTDIPGVKPARYMGRFHWVTIVDVRRFPADYLRELIAWSYDKAVGSLPKRERPKPANRPPGALA